MTVFEPFGAVVPDRYPVRAKSVGAFGSLKKPALNSLVPLLNRQMLTTEFAGLTSAAMFATGVPTGLVMTTLLQPRLSTIGENGVAPATWMPAGPPMFTVVDALVVFGSVTIPV